MTLRSPLAPLAVLLLASLAAGCAGAQQARLRGQLDGYSIGKPLPEVWPEALRYVNNRGFQLVGKDRKVLGEDEQSFLGKMFTNGHDTQQVSSRRWESETASNTRRERYRIVGIDTGAGTCRIEYYSVSSGDPLRGAEIGAPEREFRDLQLELELIENYDVDAADRMAAAARGK